MTGVQTCALPILIRATDSTMTSIASHRRLLSCSERKAFMVIFTLHTQTDACLKGAALAPGAQALTHLLILLSAACIKKCRSAPPIQSRYHAWRIPPAQRQMQMQRSKAPVKSACHSLSPLPRSVYAIAPEKALAAT
mgnify:CR=1 FL=1